MAMKVTPSFVLFIRKGPYRRQHLLFDSLWHILDIYQLATWAHFCSQMAELLCMRFLVSCSSSQNEVCSMPYAYSVVDCKRRDFVRSQVNG
jgi:hypothetical protein